MDQKLLFLINRAWTAPGFDRLMAILSSAALWAVPLAVIAVGACLWGGFRARVFVVLALVSFGISDGVLGRALKHAVGRPRPYQSQAGVRQIDLASPVWRGLFRPLKEKSSTGDEAGQPGGSFPSNHAANTAAVALVAALVWRRRGWLAFLPALGVAYSRVYIGAHWPSDVAAGLCLGVGTAALVLALAEFSWRRWAARLAPRLASAHPTLLTADSA